MVKLYAEKHTVVRGLKIILKNKGNPTTYKLYFFRICTILRNMNAEREETRKFKMKLELLTGSGSQIELYFEKMQAIN